jgi:hypothetical protein
VKEKIKILVSSCEYGDFTFKGHEDKVEHYNGYEIRSIVHTDNESLAAKKSMHPRVYGKVNKMMNWDLYPGYDYYVWRDARIFFKSSDCVVDFVESLVGNVGFFNHRFNDSIQKELEYIEKNKQLKYISSRYNVDLIESQVKKYLSDGMNQKHHFEGGLFCYSKSLIENRQSNLMKSWFCETMMWSENDQISLPYAIWCSGVIPYVYSGNVIENKWTINDYTNYC